MTTPNQLKTVLWALLGILASPLQGQNPTADSLSHRLTLQLDLQDRARTLGRLALEAYQQEPQWGLTLADSGLTLARHCENPRVTMDLLGVLSTLKWQVGDYASAAGLTSELIHQSRTLKDSLLLQQSLSLMGGLQGELANYSESLEYFLEALRIREHLGGQTAVIHRDAALEGDIGTTYLLLKDTANAMVYYQKALTRVEDDPTDPMGQTLHNNLSILYGERGQMDLAWTHNEKALKYSISSIRDLFYAQIQRGYLYQKLGDLKQAELAFKEALAMAPQLNPSEQMEVDKTLGDFYSAQGERAEAERAYQKALQTGDSHQNKQALHDLHFSMARHYSKYGLSEKAAFHWEKVAAYRDSLYTGQLATKSAQLSAQYEIEKQLLENAALRRTQAAQADQIQRQHILIILSAISILLLVALLVYRRHIQRRLIRQQRALEAAHRDRNRFFSIIAHDLRHPFQTLTSFIRIMERNAAGFSTEEIVQFTAQLKDNVNTTATLLENLLEWSQSQTGRLRFAPCHMNLTPLVDRVLQQAYATAQAKGVFLVNTIEDPIMLTADRHMLETILRNLVSNAIKYTQPGGEVRVNASLLGDRMELWVTDTGVGMTAEAVNKLFALDHRYSTRGTEDERGSGLGLLLCQEFVLHHDGTLSVESQPGEGSTFTVALPVDSPA